MDTLLPEEGRFTFDHEGHEGGPYHSRKFHVPSLRSGLTLGRGYDMKTKTAQQIQMDLVRSGVDVAIARKISKAAGLEGLKARKFIQDEQLSDFEISQATQLMLFNLVYREERERAKRLCEKKDVEKIYGSCSWDTLKKPVKEFIVDLTYQGLYTPEMRSYLQKSVLSNNLEQLRSSFEDALSKLGLKLDYRNEERLRFLSDQIKLQAN